MQACVTYAAALEKQACEMATKIAQQDLEELQNMPEQHAAAAALYRKAAGVYDHASEQYVSQLTGAKQADRYQMRRTNTPYHDSLFCCPGALLSITYARHAHQTHGAASVSL